MALEKLAQTLIYIHAGLGGIALVAGGIALAVIKGSKGHRKAGKVFYYSMLGSALIALMVSVMPHHQNPFLFSIGVFSIYFLWSGYRSLKFKQKTFKLQTDRLIAALIILTGLLMILFPMVAFGKLNLILLVFGLLSLLFGIRDLRLYKDMEQLKESWLKLHLGKMTGGYIAAVSAFMVVNQIIPGMWNWFAPAIVGSVYITYWMTKLNKSSRT